MVEKIIVNPESIRAYGNIIMPKTGADFTEYNCTMEVSEDTVNGEDVTVYVLTPETTTISLVLTSDVSTVTAGGNVVLSVTVTEDDVPVSGQSVSFKLGSTELGTSTTNSSGVATYTYTTVSSGSLNFSAVYAGHSSNGVSVVVNKRSTSTSLSLGSASIVVGGSTTASATVTSSSSGVSGLTVTFKDGTTSLGTATTNSSGVATYTLSGLAVGSHSITAVVTATDTYDTSTSSASTLTVLDHSYSLAFSQSSYAASGGSATLELTLTDNSVPVSGATISISGSDSSSYSCITNSSGVGTVTVSNVSSETTFTASYQGATDTCTVTVGPSYLFYDDCTSSSGLSNYGSSISIWKTNTATANISYDSTENAYLLKGSGNYNAIIPITAVSNLDNYVMTFKAKHKVNSPYSQPSYFNYDTNTPTQPTSYGVRYLGDGRIMCDTFTSTNDTSSNTVTGKTSGIASEYFTYKITKQGTSLHFEIERANSTNIYNKTMSVANNYKGIAFGLATESGESNSSYYIKEIKIEAL